MRQDFETMPEAEKDNKDLDLHKLFAILYKYRRTIFLSVVICTTLALVYGAVSTPTYRGRARVLVENSRPKITKVEDVILPDRVDQISYYNSQIEILKSHMLAKLVFEELGRKYVPWNARAGSLPKKTDVSDGERINDLLKHIRVKPARLTRIIEITVDDPDPVLAAKITNAWVNAYILFSSFDQLVQRKNELQADIAQKLKYIKEKHPVILGLRSEIENIDKTINNQKKRIASAGDKTLRYGVIEETALITNVKILDEAQVPRSPARPNKMLNVLVSLVFGLLYGLFMAIVFENLDQSVKAPSDIENILKLPCLVAIPFYIREKGAPKILPELLSTNDGHSITAENFRALRTSILFSNPDLSKKSLVITSAGPLEGKTTIAVNLAISFAQAYEKTIIIDADLRKPRLHTLFGLDHPKGLTELLAYGSDDISSFVQDVSIPNLHVLPAGVIPPNPSEILGSKKMEELIKKVSSMYDRVIIDTPPVLAAADAVILSTKASAAVLVVAAGVTHKQAALWVSKSIRSVHSKLLGVVLNKVKTSEYQTHYYYYHHYGYDKKNKKSRNDKHKPANPRRQCNVPVSQTSS